LQRTFCAPKKTLMIFTVPTREQVSTENQLIFDKLHQQVGFVPNMYAFFAHSPTALRDYLTLQGRRSSLRSKEREVINLVVSQHNDCQYCLAAHTQMGSINGLTEQQMLEVRAGRASFDAKLDALAQLTLATVSSHGKPSPTRVTALLEAGYTSENLVDVIMVIGDKIMTNYLHGITGVPIDFPQAPQLATA